MHHQGLDDETIAQRLTAQGYRSPLDPTRLLPSTVKGIRLKHRVFVTRSQSHPRRIIGYLTIPQAAVALGISPYWFYDRIKKRVIGISRDQSTGLYLFPDTPQTLDQFRDLQAGNLNQLPFKSRPQIDRIGDHRKVPVWHFRPQLSTPHKDGGRKNNQSSCPFGFGIAR